MQRIEVIAVESVFQFIHLKIVQPLEFHVCIGECLAESGLIRRQEVESSILTFGIDDELSKVITSHLRSIDIHESWRGATDETGNACDAFVFHESAPDGICHETCISQTLSIGKKYLNGKLVTVGIGEESNLERENEE